MKKYIALFDVIILLSIGYIMSVNIPMPKDNATGMFSMFEYLFKMQRYDSVEYIALNPENISEEDRAEFTFLMKKYCLFHGHTFLYKTFDELKDEGYIIDGRFENGIVFGFDSLTIEDGIIVGNLYFYLGNLGGFGSELKAEFMDQNWNIEPTHGYWVS